MVGDSVLHPRLIQCSTELESAVLIVERISELQGETVDDQVSDADGRMPVVKMSSFMGLRKRTVKC